jgi:hypothetical protein
MKSLVKKDTGKAGVKVKASENTKPAQCCAKTSKIIVGCHD